MSFDLAFHRDGVQTDGAKGGGTFAFAPQARYQVDHGIVVEILCGGKGAEKGAAVVKWLAHATRDQMIPFVGGSNLLGAGISERRFGILA